MSDTASRSAQPVPDADPSPTEGSALGGTKPQVTVTSFSKCQCEHPEFDGEHVVLHTYPTDLDRGNAVAISYALGSFDREDRLIGHDVVTKEAVYLNLGDEWTVPELIMRLVELTESDTAIWIDQLSIPQRSFRIREVLADIPSIYSTLDVVIVLPGSICSCLSTVARRWQRKVTWLDIADSEVCCLNALGFCSHFNRLWTHQEFQYARCVRLVWCHAHPATCFQPKSSPRSWDSDLTLYAKLTLRKFRQMPLAESESEAFEDLALTALKMSQTFFASAMMANYAVRGSGLLSEKVQGLVNLWLGERLAKASLFSDKRESLEEIWEHSVEPFLAKFAWLGSVPLLASSIKDHVLAVWPAVPGYRVPANHRECSVGELLENAGEFFETTKQSYIPFHTSAHE